MAFLRAVMKTEMTVVICGKVGSGKTYLSMALANEIPLSDRLCTVQDADEWAALPHPNRVDLFYSKGEQGAARVTPNDLVEASLRLAMKWLLLQELRGAEAFSFMRARRSGHPGLTTCHADNAQAVFPTLALMVKQHSAAASMDLPAIEQALRGLIDVVVHVHRPEGRFEISEVHFGLAERAGAV
jgi:type IV secretion system protein VirB11